MAEIANDQRQMSFQDYLIPSQDKTATDKVISIPKEHYRTRDFKLLRPDYWFYEICSLIIGIVCLVCIIVLLKIYDGKESPQWAGNITINTVVSWLSTVLQTCLLMPTAAGISQLCWVRYSGRTGQLNDVCHYDAASRGPWGSLLLLYRARKLYLAVFGAALSLLLIFGLSPFIQQTIQYDPQERPDLSLQAQTVAAYSYNGVSPDNDGQGPFATLFEAIPYNMRSAIYSGLLSPNTFLVPSPLFSCPSGNCTWEPFSTLVINSRCTDISSSIRLNCSDIHYVQDPNQSCAFEWLAEPPWLQNFNATNLMASAVEVPASLNPGNMTGLFSSIRWVKALDNIAHFPFSQTSSGPPYIMPNTTFEAFNCSFFFSVQQLQAAVINGIYSEKILDEEIKGQLLDLSAVYPNVLFNPSFATDISPGHSNFSVGGTQLNMFMSEFQNTFSGSIDTGDDSVTGTSFFEDMMWQSPNLTQSLGSMVTYMTNALRGNDSQLLEQAERNASLIAPDQAVLGTVFVQKQIVVVHWIWLTFPAAMAIGVALFLGATFVVSSRNSLGVWKDSPLVLLFHANLMANEEGLSEADIQNLRSLRTADAMESAASKIKVRVDSGNSDGQIRLFTDGM